MGDSPEEAWLQGQAAGADGGSQTLNPFSGGAELALDWLDGWQDGTRHRNRLLPDAEGVAAGVFLGADVASGPSRH